MTNQKISQKNSKNLILEARFLDGLAFFVSAILSPYIVAAFFILVIFYIYAGTLKEFLPWLSIALLFTVIIPGVFVLWQVQKKKIKDLHMADLHERKMPFIISSISSLVGVAILYFIGATKPIMVIVTTYAVNVAVIAIITYFWKISIHSALFSASTIIAIILFGPRFWPLWFLWFPLAWSRVFRKRHTPEQVLVGAVAAALITCLVFFLFGYKIGE